MHDNIPKRPRTSLSCSPLLSEIIAYRREDGHETNNNNLYLSILSVKVQWIYSLIEITLKNI
jgi:hypothetical protein